MQRMGFAATALSLLLLSTLSAPRALHAQTLPTFNVSSYNASGANGTGICSGSAGSTTLTGCAQPSGNYDFQIGQGIVVYGAGPAAATAPTAQPTVTQIGSGTGSHTYCYVVDTVDPLVGISAPSPQKCISNEPALSYNTTWNALSTPSSNVGPSPAFLWYVSQDGGPWQLVSVVGISNQGPSSGAQDVGQRVGTRGGWPNGMSSPDIHKNQDFFTYITGANGSNVFVNDALPSTFSNAAIGHDDTRAVQSTIDAAAAAGGGIVQFAAGIYNIKRPFFYGPSGFSTKLSDDNPVNQFNYLHVAGTNVAHIHMQGQGSGTVLVAAPDHGGFSQFMALGPGGRPSDTAGMIAIAPVAKGATQLTLVNGSDAASLSAGKDIYLYSGSFTGGSCTSGNGVPGDCHFSELNTVASISGTTVQLTYPASKRFYNDGTSSFGLNVVPNKIHDFALASLNLTSSIAIFSTGEVYGLLVDTVTINGSPTHGVFGGGYKRDVTIQNSTWSFGTGDASFSNTDEYDQFTNLQFLKNTITGNPALGTEGAGSATARLYATEGSSQVTFKGNQLTNASIYIDQTTDDVISNNKLTNGIITVGTSYGPTTLFRCFAPNQDASFSSYGSQASLDIDTNTISIGTGYIFPYLIRAGDFTQSTIANNIITYASARDLSGITTSSGTVSGNSFSSTGSSTGSAGICLVPDESSTTAPTSFTVQGNTIGATTVNAGIYVPNPGFTDPAPLCIRNNTFKIQNGPQVKIDNPQSINQSCPQ